MSNVKSPDDIALAACSAMLRFAYRRFGISPLVIQFYPLLATLSVTCLLFIHIGLTADVERASYLAASAVTAFFGYAFWKDHAVLRAEMKSEWNTVLYRKHEALALSRRTRLVSLRMCSVVYALLLTVLVFSGISDEIVRLAPWQAAALPANMLVLTLYMYTKSAELPLPGGGDFVISARMSQTI
jgi:hypothetical protein